MTQLLERALEQVRRLTAEEQDAIAALILDELQDEERWQAVFAASQEQLGVLAGAALEEYHAGRTLQLAPDPIP